jgi:hypothetical protein
LQSITSVVQKIVLAVVGDQAHSSKLRPVTKNRAVNLCRIAFFAPTLAE